MYSHTVEQCSEPSGGRRCHQELVTAGILVPLPAGEKEKGAVVRWRSIKREVNGLQVRPARCGRRPATRYAQQLIRLLPVRGLPSACAGGGGAGQHCCHGGARLGCFKSGQEGKLRARQGGWRAAAEEEARDALESSGSRPCTRLDAPMGSSGRVPRTVYSQSV